MKDYLVKAYAYGGTVRIYTASTTNLVEEAREIHDLWPTSAAAFGRLLTAGVIMGAMYKGDQELTIRYDGDGPLKGMVATTKTNGEVRGYVGNPHVFLQYNNGKLNVGQAVGNGFIHVTKDLKVRNIFTTSAEIQTGEIAEDFAYYFTKSEQIPSAVGLGVLVNDDNTVKASGGFILQVMPGCKEESIKLIEERLAKLLPVSEMIEKGYTPEQMMFELAGEDHQILETLDLRYHCDCEKVKFEKGIISLGKAEIQAMIDEDGHAEAVCGFCQAKYVFNKGELMLLKTKSK